MTLLDTYARAPLTIVAGEGCELIDESGQRYLDFIGGLAVSALGHAHPAIADAIAAQARTLTHASNLYHHEPAGLLARELVERSGMSGAFFCNSGTEANEAAIKLARKWAYRRNEHGRRIILACTGSFHGRTFGSLAATANASLREGFEPLPDGFAFVAFNDVAALRDAIDDRTAAFIVEPVQGESGVNVATVEFLTTARELCDARDALLIFDEIQCGTGRTGSFFAFESFGVATRRGHAGERSCKWPADRRGACQRTRRVRFPAGRSRLDVRRLSDSMRRGARPSPDSRRARSRSPRARALGRALCRSRATRAIASGDLGTPARDGAPVGVPVRAPYDAKDIVGRARGRGLLIGSAGGNTLRFAPPLIVSRRDVERGVSLLAAALEK